MLKILAALEQTHPEILEALAGHTVDSLPAGVSVSDQVARNSYHILLLEDDPAAVEALRRVDPRIEILLFGTRDLDPVEVITHGAAGYFRWPAETVRLKEGVKRIEELAEMRRDTAELEKLLTEKYTFEGLVARNPQMLETFTFIRRVAPHYRVALISGETGTGKEVLAKALHASSPSAGRPFVVCNCGALVEGLIESELFGHLKGSFTGAVRDKAGLFEAAGDGTLFLDEIGELPPSFQPRLLRVLQDGEFRRVGSNTASRAACRVVAATNRNLESEVASGRFREDLYFRLTPITLKVPPLRERKDDLPLLIRFLLDRFRKRTGKNVFGISRPAQALLITYDWPGNVRELENVIERAAILTTEPFIRTEDIPSQSFKTKPGSETQGVIQSLKEMEKNHIKLILGQCNGNRSNASKILGISRRSLIRKIQQYGLS